MNRDSTVNPFAPPATAGRLLASEDTEPELAGSEFEPLAELLTKTRPWVRTMSVLVLLASALSVLPVLVAMVRLASVRIRAPFEPGKMWFDISVCGLIFVPTWLAGYYLWRYASGITRFARTRHLVALEATIDAQRKYWRLIAMVCYALVGVAAITAVVRIAMYVPTR